MEMGFIGAISFYVGLVLAIVLAIIFAAGIVPTWGVILLGVIGLIVGLLNITDTETAPFLIASIAFLISFGALSTLIGTLALGWTAVQTFFTLLQVFVAPAAAIVALKTIYEVTKGQ